MRAGYQTFLAEAGEAACYALSIVKIAERVTGKAIDPEAALIEAIERNYIHYSWDNPNDNQNFYVERPDEFLDYLTKRKWYVRKESGEYRPQYGEYLVERWERTRTGITTGHFRLPDWDSLVNSQTVKYGSRVSTRVFRLAG